MLTQRFASWLRRLNRPAGPRMAVLALEQLEARNVPSVAANNVFVSSLYQGLLGRNADQAGLTYWTPQLNSGVSRTQVAVDIAGSNEALGHDVGLFYDTLLNRPADADGLNYWMGQLDSGATLDDAKAGILGSNEFFTKAGGTNEGFVNALYSDELGRSVDPAGLNYWENQLNAGVSRTTVADEVLATPEAKNEKVTNFFNDLLGRAPDANGLNYWSDQLQAGVPEAQVVGGMLGSNEYFAHVQNTAAAPTEVDPNQAASDMIGSLGLFTGPRPNAENLALRPVVTPPVVTTPVTTPVVVAQPAPTIAEPAPEMPVAEPAPVVVTTPPTTNQPTPAAPATTPAATNDNAAPQTQDQSSAAPPQNDDTATQQTDDSGDETTSQNYLGDPSALEDGTEPVDMSDYNTFWEVAESPTPPDPYTLDYNTYWEEVQAQELWQEMTATPTSD